MDRDVTEKQADSIFSDFSDEKLCELSRLGSSEAEDVLIRRYVQIVRAYARPFFLSGGDSEDLVQEGMIGLLSALRDYRPEVSSFKTFAVLCIRRSIISAVRTSQTKRNNVLNSSLSFEQLLREDGVELQATAQDPESLVISKYEKEQLKNGIFSKLSEFEQQVLNLFLDGFSYSDMAIKLGCTRKSIDNAVQRIRRKLAE